MTIVFINLQQYITDILLAYLNLDNQQQYAIKEFGIVLTISDGIANLLDKKKYNLAQSLPISTLIAGVIKKHKLSWSTKSIFILDNYWICNKTPINVKIEYPTPHFDLPVLEYNIKAPSIDDAPNEIIIGLIKELYFKHNTIMLWNVQIFYLNYIYRIEFIFASPINKVESIYEKDLKLLLGNLYAIFHSLVVLGLKHIESNSTNSLISQETLVEKIKESLAYLYDLPIIDLSLDEIDVETQAKIIEKMPEIKNHLMAYEGFLYDAVEDLIDFRIKHGISRVFYYTPQK